MKPTGFNFVCIQLLAEWKEIVNDTRDLSEIENDFFDNMFCQDKIK